MQEEESQVKTLEWPRLQTGEEFHVVELWASRLINPNCSERLYLVLCGIWTSSSRVSIGFFNKGFPVSYLTYRTFFFLQQMILKTLIISIYLLLNT